MTKPQPALVRYCKNPECDKTIPDYKPANTEFCATSCKNRYHNKRRKEAKNAKPPGADPPATDSPRTKKRTRRFGVGVEVRNPTGQPGAEVQVLPTQVKRPKPDAKQPRPTPTPDQPYASVAALKSYDHLAKQWIAGQTWVEVLKWRGQDLNKWSGHPNDPKWYLVTPEHKFTQKLSYERMTARLLEEYPLGGYFQIRFFYTDAGGPEALGHPIIVKLDPALDEDDMKHVHKILQDQLDDKNATITELKEWQQRQEREEMSAWRQMAQDNKEQAEAAREEAKGATGQVLDMTKEIFTTMSEQLKSENSGLREQMQTQQQWWMQQQQAAYQSPDWYSRYDHTDEDDSNGLVAVLLQTNQQNAQLQQQNMQFQAQMAQENRAATFQLVGTLAGALAPVLAGMVNKDDGGQMDKFWAMQQQFAQQQFNLQEKVLDAKKEALDVTRGEDPTWAAIKQKAIERFVDPDGTDGPKSTLSQVGDLVERAGVPDLLRTVSERWGQNQDGGGGGTPATNWQDNSDLRPAQYTQGATQMQLMPEMQTIEQSPPAPQPAHPAPYVPEMQPLSPGSNAPSQVIDVAPEPPPAQVQTATPAQIAIPSREMLPDAFFQLVSDAADAMAENQNAAHFCATLPDEAIQHLINFSPDAVIATVQHYAPGVSPLRTTGGRRWLQVLIESAKALQ